MSQLIETCSLFPHGPDWKCSGSRPLDELVKETIRSLEMVTKTAASSGRRLRCRRSRRGAIHRSAAAYQAGAARIATAEYTHARQR